MANMSGAQYIAQTLEGYGVSHVFYIEAILRRTLVEMEKIGIKRILTHSEKSAAYMADGFARAGLKPGVCMAQSVGAANLAAGLQDAYLGRSPVIALTGRKPPAFQYRNAYQEILHNDLYDQVTKYNVELDSLEQLQYLLPQAFREATSGMPRPVHIDFLGYEGNLTDEAEADLNVTVEQRYGALPPRRPAPEAADIEEAVKVLKNAKRPVLVVGRGVVVSGAQELVNRIVDAHSIPVASSVDGKGVVSDDHPLSLGPVGTYCKPCANKIVSEADCVVFVGTNTGDQVTKNWTLPILGTPVIQIDIDPHELGRNYPGAVGICGDALTSLAMLADALPKDLKFGEWAEKAASCIKDWKKSVEANRTSGNQPIRPERLGAELSAVLPEDAVVVADTGYSAIWAATMIDITSPKQSFIRAAGSLGWAFPASLGAKCAVGDRPVYCFCGDGALWYHVGELETAKRWNINTVTVVNNNSVLGQCLLGIGRAYRDDEGCREDMSAFEPTNFAELAESMGCKGIRVTDPAKIGDAIREASEAGGPAVVDVVTDSTAHPTLS